MRPGWALTRWPGTGEPLLWQHIQGDGTAGLRAARSGGQQSRTGTKAITVHFPEEVRRQLKTMAGEQGRDVADMVAEGLNLLFARYEK